MSEDRNGNPDADPDFITQAPALSCISIYQKKVGGLFVCPPDCQLLLQQGKAWVEVQALSFAASLVRFRQDDAGSGFAVGTHAYELFNRALFCHLRSRAGCLGFFLLSDTSGALFGRYALDSDCCERCALVPAATLSGARALKNFELRIVLNGVSNALGCLTRD